jgi:hypothetical protein
MNSPLLPEILVDAQQHDQAPLSLATEGVELYVCESAFGPMLIEVRDGAAFASACHCSVAGHGKAGSGGAARGTALEPIGSALGALVADECRFRP